MAQSGNADGLQRRLQQPVRHGAARHVQCLSDQHDDDPEQVRDNDPNAMMYVLNSNIAAVRAEDAAGTVSSGLQGNDAIQPLVLRAHMGDCVTVNFTNATTFGLESFDQSAPSQASEPCTPVTATNPDGSTRVVADCAGSLSHTRATEPGLERRRPASRRQCRPGVQRRGQERGQHRGPGQDGQLRPSTWTRLWATARTYSTRPVTTTMSQVHGLFGVLVSEPVGSQWLDPHTLQP